MTHVLVRAAVPAPVLPRAEDVWRSAVAVGTAERAGVIVDRRRGGGVAEEERAEELGGEERLLNIFLKKTTVS